MPQNSGYKGKWEPNDRTFDNRFIQTIAKDAPWKAVVCIEKYFQMIAILLIIKIFFKTSRMSVHQEVPVPTGVGSLTEAMGFLHSTLMLQFVMKSHQILPLANPIAMYLIPKKIQTTSALIVLQLHQLSLSLPM